MPPCNSGAFRKKIVILCADNLNPKYNDCFNKNGFQLPRPDGRVSR